MYKYYSTETLVVISNRDSISNRDEVSLSLTLDPDPCTLRPNDDEETN